MQFEFETPIGPLTLVTDEGRLVSELRFGKADSEDGLSPSETVRVSRPVQELVQKLHLYFAQQEPLLGIEDALDWSKCTPFQCQVYQAACAIPLGETITYGELAGRIGSPKATRAVGGALGRNPFPIVIPCHRIVAANGSLGGFFADLSIKASLLDLEQAGAQGLHGTSRGQGDER